MNPITAATLPNFIRDAESDGAIPPILFDDRTSRARAVVSGFSRSPPEFGDVCYLGTGRNLGARTPNSFGFLEKHVFSDPSEIKPDWEQHIWDLAAIGRRFLKFAPDTAAALWGHCAFWTDRCMTRVDHGGDVRVREYGKPKFFSEGAKVPLYFARDHATDSARKASIVIPTGSLRWLWPFGKDRTLVRAGYSCLAFGGDRRIVGASYREELSPAPDCRDTLDRLDAGLAPALSTRFHPLRLPAGHPIAPPRMTAELHVENGILDVIGVKWERFLPHGTVDLLFDQLSILLTPDTGKVLQITTLRDVFCPNGANDIEAHPVGRWLLRQAGDLR
jgi:hypothetical protein